MRRERSERTQIIEKVEQRDPYAEAFLYDDDQLREEERVEAKIEQRGFGIGVAVIGAGLFLDQRRQAGQCRRLRRVGRNGSCRR